MLLLAACSPVSDVAESPQRASSARPNVVWIVLDACRAGNLSCYGYERATSPSIDALAARGVLFEQHYAQANSTTPSVSSYMTGRYFPSNCLRDPNWRHLFRNPPPDEQLLPAVLQDNGYHTLAVSASPFLVEGWPLWQAFTEAHYVPPRDTEQGAATFEALNEILVPWIEESPKQPFFVYVHAMDTHFPHYLKPPYDEWLDPDLPEERRKRLANVSLFEAPFSPADQQHLRGLHDGGIRYADDQVRAVIDALGEAGFLDNTIVIVGADHGDVLGEDGASVQHTDPRITQDEVLHVPFIISGPGLPRGKRVAALTENVDIFPTLIDLLGLTTDAVTEGVSLMKLVNDPASTPPRSFAFAKTNAAPDFNAVAPKFVLRGDDFKLEFTPATGKADLWRTPDLTASRVGALREHPDVAKTMEAHLEQHFVPRFIAWQKRPLRAPDRRFTEYLPQSAQPAGIHTKLHEAMATDDKWFLSPATLSTNTAQEDAPPITLTFEVPNGNYHVVLRVKPRTAFKVRAQGEADFRLVADEAEEVPGATFSYLELGQYTVENGQFVLALQEGSNERPAALEALLFDPAGDSDGPSVQTDDERIQQIRALGYVE